MRRLRLGIATSEEHSELTSDDQRFLTPLRSLRVEPTPAIWSTPSARWTHFDAVLIRSCWDYHLRPTEFRAWLDDLHAHDVPIVNTHRHVVWNMDKRYLRELSTRGVRIPETVFVERGASTPLVEVFEAHGLRGPFVIKPTISATANETWITDAERAETDQRRFENILAASGAMVQRFAPEVRTEGEWSLVFFDSELSHAVRKLPADGDFRVQGEFGGSSHVETAPAHVVHQARAVLDRVDGPITYARVDGIQTGGEFTLLELELIEPDLFLRMDPAAPERFARAIATAMSGVSESRGSAS